MDRERWQKHGDKYRTRNQSPRKKQNARVTSKPCYVNLCISKHALRGLFSSCKWRYPPSSFPPPRAPLLFSPPFIAKWIYLLMPAGFQTLSTVVWQASPPKLQRLLIDDRALSHFQTIATLVQLRNCPTLFDALYMRNILQMCDETTLTNYLHCPMVAPIYYLGVQSCSWRATILQSSAPTLIKHAVTS